MVIELRPHQVDSISEVKMNWFRGITNQVIVLPTGAGKTLVKAALAKDAYSKSEITLVFAHRDVLLEQISNALCMMDVPHGFIASRQTITAITNLNVKRHGSSYHSETSPVIVTSVDTFYPRVRKGLLGGLLHKVKLWLMDESHHLIKTNKWGECVKHLVNAKGVGVTATPLRNDKKGLGSHVDGVFETLIQKTDMGALIKQGFLCPYRIFTPPDRVDTSNVNTTSSGDFNRDQLAANTDKIEITGDAVTHYLRILSGQRVITFTVNIKHAENVADTFNKAGVPSRAVSSKTPIAERAQALLDFQEGRILNLVNCDLFSEGFDVPSVAGVIMLRKTKSYGMFKQQFGRMLRVLEGKSSGVLIDHVGNTERMMREHHLETPHSDPAWTLDRPETKKKREAKDAGRLLVTRICPECEFFYVPVGETYTCPDCGHSETQAQKEAAQQKIQVKEVDLVEMNIDFINEILAQRNKVEESPEALRHRMIHAPAVVRNSAVNNHIKRQHAQQQLKTMIQAWCVRYATKSGFAVKTVQAEFERQFNINILKAQVMSERHSLELTERIQQHLMSYDSQLKGEKVI